MKKSALTFQWLEVIRMPGFETGGFRLDELCSGINIIYGPNASGKTTTARSFQGVLWPSLLPASSVSLRAAFRVEEEEWHLETDNRYLRCLRQGVETSSPVSSPSESAVYYRLSLPDLLAADDAPLAQVIQRESIGGFDIDGVADRLDWRKGNYSRGKSEVKALEESILAARKARAAQEELRERERDLKVLREDRELARKARSRLTSLERAEERAERLQELQLSKQELESFPEALQYLQGDEDDRLTQLRAEIEEYQRKRQREESRIASARLRLQEEKLPEDGLSSESLHELEERIDRLNQIESQKNGQARELEKSRKKASDLVARVHSEIKLTRLAEVDAPAIDLLSRLLRKAEELRGQVAAREALRNWLGNVEEPADIEQLERSRNLLIEWLASPDEQIDRTLRRFLWSIPAVLLLFAVAFYLLQSPGWMVAALIAAFAGLVWLIRGLRKSDRQAGFREDYEASSMERPAEWNRPQIKALADTLSRRLDQERLKQEKWSYWQTRSAPREEMESLRGEVENLRREVGEKLGGAPASDELKLVWLADQLRQWQQAVCEVKEFDQTVNQREEELRLEFEKTNAKLQACGCLAVHDLSEARARLKGLKQRWEKYQEADRDLKESQKMLREEILPRLQTLSEERRRLFSKIRLSEPEEDKLKDWLRQLQIYREVREKVEMLSGEVDRLGRLLQSEPELLEKPLEELQEERRLTQAQAEKEEELLKEISSIEARIEIAKKGHSLEEALEAVERARESLRRLRSEELDARLGSLLADRLREETQGKNLPPVFHHARQLFSTISRGRYELNLVPSIPPAFQLLETRTRRPRALQELSSGTRLQLLVAVRMAFVEFQEQSLLLPLILDETLANSDENRARALIEAALEVARKGRQVFYFTAQNDEVGKWNSILAKVSTEEVPRNVIDLSEVRGLGEAERMDPIPLQSPVTPSVPSPNGLSHEEYGSRLKITPVPLLDEGASHLHLWYLIEDVNLLHRVLQKEVSTWGQLAVFLKDDLTEAVLNVPASAFVSTRAAARAAETMVRAKEVGKGKPVDRVAILESGFSKTQRLIEETIRLAEAVGGDAARLLQELEKGAVKGFRAASRERLQEFLEEHGYLDLRSPLTPQEIRTRALSVVKEELQRNEISVEEIDRLLHRLTAGIPA